MTSITFQRRNHHTARDNLRETSALESACPNRHADSLHTASAGRSRTTLTWVERNFGYAVARAYAGHTDRGSDAGATTTYVRATPSEVATALSALTGEPHPLAIPGGGSAW